MSDRIQIDIEGLRPKIEAFAKLERRPSLSQMCRVLIEEALEARPDPLADKTSESEGLQFIRAIAMGKRPSNRQIVKAAQELDIPEERLMAIRDHLFPKKPLYENHE